MSALPPRHGAAIALAALRQTAHHPRRTASTVIASEAKQSIDPGKRKNGLLCRCAPRNGELNRRRTPMSNDIEELTALNHDYVASVQNCDVKRFDQILAQDFYCSNPDKSLVDRAAFLKQTAVPVTIKNLRADDVKIRVLGDFAIIHAATSYTTADGQQARGRYTDCWAKQNGKWLAVSAHVSR
jgi:ketosteroid isomerase-like protein